jgi:membrane-associated phospholipid phosphatase
VDFKRSHQRAACFLTNALNPFFIFTALYALVAVQGSSTARAAVYVGAEVIAAAFVAGYVLLLRRSRKVRDFWISTRAERLAPALVLLGAFVALLGALALLEAPGALLRMTLAIGLASATIAATTFVWKASAHCTVAGHAAAAGLLILGPPGLLFVLILPTVLWSRIASGAHTPVQTLAGAGVGATFALALLG